MVKLIVLGLLAALAAVFFLFRWQRRRRARRAQTREFLSYIPQIRAALDEFERSQEFEDRIRLLADIVRYCSNAFRHLPQETAIMDVARLCEDERVKLCLRYAVDESRKSMNLVQQTEKLRMRAARMDQVAQALKVCSRYLFPHERITNAMRAAVRYQETLETSRDLPEDQQAEAIAAAQPLLAPYFQIIAELDTEANEIAQRAPWAGADLRARLDRIEARLG